MGKKIPTYEISVDGVDSPNPAVNFVALVDFPAIEKGFMMFSKHAMKVSVKEGESKDDYLKRCIPAEINNGHAQDQAVAMCSSIYDNKQNYKSKFGFKVDPAQKERRIITGPLMLTDTPIYRYTEERGEFNVIFRKDQTETILKKFAKQGIYNNVNLMHTQELQPSGIYMLELFMIDKQRGIKTPSMFDEAPDGSIFASYYVENDTLWNEYIMKGRYTGFSVECFMDVLFSSQKDPLESAFTEMAKNFT